MEAVSRVERGVTLPSLRTLSALALVRRYAHLSVDRLVPYAERYAVLGLGL